MITKITNFKIDGDLDGGSTVEYAVAPFKEICSLFAVMVVALELTVLPRQKRMRKATAFSFSVDDAHAALSNMRVSPARNRVQIELQYVVEGHLVRRVMQSFFDAHLVHCPRARTSSRADPGLLLQPTAKGVAVVHQFCLDTGFGPLSMPPIVGSVYNSMRIIPLDRDKNDMLVCSRALLQYVHQRLVGSERRTWRPDAPPDPISGKMEAAELVNLSVSDDGLACFQMAHLPPGEPRTSPYHHPYFTNPESDAHCQYYTAELGVRFMEIREKIAITTKGLCQWLCDCTAVASRGEAARMVDILVTSGHFAAVDKLRLPAGNPVYTPKAPDWTEDESTSPRIHSLQDVVADPGFRLLFQDHLASTFCAENLAAYTSISKLNRAIVQVVDSVVPLVTGKKVNSNTRTKLMQILHSLMAKALLVYNSHFDPDAPTQLNIPYDLKNRISHVVSPGRSESDSLVLAGADLQVATLVSRLHRISSEYTKAEAAVLRLLETDSLPNFVASAGYRRFLHGHTLSRLL